MLVNNIISGKSCWSISEDQQLHINVKKYGTNWKKVSEDNLSRTEHGCRNRWHILTGKKTRNNNNNNNNNNDNNNQNKHDINNHQIIIEKEKRYSSHIDLSNRDITFENNNNNISPTNTPTGTTNSFTITNIGFINSNNNHKRNDTNNYSNKNLNNTISNLKRGITTTAAITTNANTIYEFMDRIKIKTTTNWSINDIYQLMIAMSHIDNKYNNDMYFTIVFDWNDIGIKINKNCYDCENVWKLVKNELSENVIGEIMKHNWKSTGF